MNAPLAVAFGRRATHEIERIDAWWRENRGDARDLFLNELRRMVAAVALMPALGAPARSARLPAVRRVLLPRTRYFLYYRVRGTTLDVLAVWHAARGSAPSL